MTVRKIQQSKVEQDRILLINICLFQCFCKCIYTKNLITKRSYYNTNKYFQQLCLTLKAIEQEISFILNTGRRGGRGISYCTSFFNSAIQTVSVRNSASSFLTFPLQQLEMADRKQHMVKRTEMQDKARSHPVQPSPKQKQRKAPFASAVGRRQGRTKSERRWSISSLVWLRDKSSTRL